MSDTPPGYLRLPDHALPVFNSLVGPFWIRPEGESITFGFRVELRHCNPMELCHGGMLTAFADIVLTGGCNHVARLSKFLTTISLSTDFIAPARIGAWVEARPEVLKVTRGMLFGQCLMTADGTPVLRASGTFRHAGDPDPRFNRIARLLEAQASAASASSAGR
ncbi:PaaI family thioesterase [Belnapia sp. T6]|uniref:PaaI family thioesterase n=1 Tax=Belnapia mucosa TaxID=2804532 RepID=A0ABS1UZJ3_9PROT|nr:PaaI family thioesterase [Belnapia mucosa]MBL6454251.1 PaaI family thioesterase [Belnapia mucosa]